MFAASFRARSRPALTRALRVAVLSSAILLASVALLTTPAIATAQAAPTSG